MTASLQRATTLPNGSEVSVTQIFRDGPDHDFRVAVKLEEWPHGVMLAIGVNEGRELKKILGSFGL